MDLTFPLEQEFAAREQEEGAEQVGHAVEALEQRRAHEDEGQAHQHGAEDSPEQDPVLRLLGDGEVLEDDQEHEQVVHREGVLGEVGGQKLGGLVPVEVQAHAHVEGHGQRHPEQ